MIALGVDPGIAHMGAALIRALLPRGTYKLIGAYSKSTTPEDGSDTARIVILREWLAGLLVSWQCDSLYPDVVAVEDVEIRRQGGEKVNPRSPMLTARVLGNVECLFPTGNVHVVRASDWRRALGCGHGTPAEVRRAVEFHVTLPARCSIHAVEAVALALTAAARAS